MYFTPVSIKRWGLENVLIFFYFSIEAYKAKLCSLINSVLIVGLGASASFSADVGAFYWDKPQRNRFVGCQR